MKFIPVILFAIFFCACKQSSKNQTTPSSEKSNSYFQGDSLYSNGFHYPKPVDANTVQWDTYAAPTKEPSTYLVTFKDTVFGSKITRVGDQKAFNSKGSHVGHNYASNAVWNSDGSLLKLNISPARILRDSDYSVAYIRDIPYEARWANTNPNLMYGITNGNQFIVHDVVNNSNTLLHTFEKYSNLTIGDGEGNQDRNDQYISFIGTKGIEKDIIVYNIKSDSIVAIKSLKSRHENLGSARVSPLGNYVIVAWNTNGEGNEQGYKAYDIQLKNERHLYDETQHYDLGIDVNGDEVIVAFGDTKTWKTKHYIIMVRIKDGYAQPLFKDEAPGQTGIWGGHISCRNIYRDGWAYISEGRASDDVAANELLAIKLDYTGNNLIERYGKHHSNRSMGYNHQARATVHPNGTKICFDSNWHDPILETWEYAPAWVLEYSQN
jgi:hypothetical protein